MTNSAILKKAIEKAVKGGYENTIPFSYYGDGKTHIEGQDLLDSVREMIKKDTHQSVIFSHSFAKAFWRGEHEMGSCPECMSRTLRGWEYHLMEMVRRKEPLQYLKKFL